MGQEHVLDVTDLEMPGPLQAVLAAVDDLPAGDYVRLFIRRDPVLLYPLLHLQGFEYETKTLSAENYQVLIWHHGDVEARQAAHQ